MTALQAQNSKEFEFAATEWKRLIKDYPKSSIVDKAFFNSGICFIQMQQYDQAIDQFKAAIPLLKDRDVQVPTAQFYLGYAQYELGSSKLSDSTQKAEATELLTTATQTLARVLKDSPTFERNDSVCYFRGGAFEKLGRLEEALDAYLQMANYKSTDKTYRFDSLFAICDLHFALGQYDKALKATERFVAAAKPVEHPLLDRVNLLQGKVHVNLAVAAQENGDSTKSDQEFGLAEPIFKSIISADPSQKPADFADLVQEAKYQQAFCLNRLRRFEAAANLYLDLVTNGDPKLADQAQAYAGANYLSAGKTDLATTALLASTQSGSEFAPDSAHLLAGIYLKKQKFENAYDIASKFIPAAAKQKAKVLIDLKLDQADAAYGIPERRKESIQLFQQLAEQHPDDKLAPAALYNAAFASLEEGDLSGAIQLASQFEAKYSQSDYLGDTLEVKADALLLDKKYEASAKVFDQLVSDEAFKGNSKRKVWQLRAGLALYLQEKYKEAIARLNPLAGNFEQATRNAEAWHWIGSSHFQLKDYSAAETAYSSALRSDSKWSRADESLAFLARSQIKTDKVNLAMTSVERLEGEYSKSKWLADVYAELGNRALDKEQFPEALKYFEKVINQFPSSNQLANSLYGAAWSLQKQKTFERADAYYQRLITDFPENSLVENAKIQRASLLRMMGKAGNSSLAELKALLETDLEDSQRVNVLLELGLAQVNNKSWPDAIKTFEQLIQLAKNDKRLPDFYYELAWAHRENQSEANAIKYFGKIANETPESTHAAEANFHMGNVAYDKQDFPEAITRFTNCLKPEASETIREKAAYKLGWSFYKQQKYPEAHGAFRDQVAKFKDGRLYADGLFMVAESLRNQKKFPEAYQAYLKAKPEVDASSEVDPKLRWLTMLHGSQVAVKAKDYSGAIDLAKGIENTDVDETFKQDVYLELGNAHKGLKDDTKAIDYWQKAAQSTGKTGARALCMLGDHYFGNKEFGKAVNQFKRVFFGFGGKSAAKDVKPWLAYARYEAARCSYVQGLSLTDDDQKNKLIREAKKHFQALLDDFPSDRLAPEARKQLDLITKKHKKAS